MSLLPLASGNGVDEPQALAGTQSLTGPGPDQPGKKTARDDRIFAAMLLALMRQENREALMTKVSNAT